MDQERRIEYFMSEISRLSNQVVDLQYERDALAARLSEIEKSDSQEVLSLKADNQALAAQVAVIKDEISDFLAALDGMLMADLSSEEIADDLEKRLSNYDVPQQHLAEIRSQAGRDGYLQGIADYQQAEAEYKDFWIDTAANQYADTIRQEKK